MTEKKGTNIVSEEKKKIVDELVKKIKKSRTVLIASTKGLPASQFQKIAKNLRGKAEISVVKKSLVIRAIGKIEKGAVQNLKEHIKSDVALMFSEIDAFELSGILTEKQSPAKAKAGDIALEDIKVESGPTDLVPGPAISELGSVGLKVSVEGGKLTIKQGAVIVKAGEAISEKAVGVMGKLGIMPMKVGFIPLAAYDAESDKVYAEIKIDKEGTLKNLREMVSKSLGFAVGIKYPTLETVKYFIMVAGREEMALEKLGGKIQESEGGN